MGVPFGQGFTTQPAFPRALLFPKTKLWAGYVDTWRLSQHQLANFSTDNTRQWPPRNAQLRCHEIDALTLSVVAWDRAAAVRASYKPSAISRSGASCNTADTAMAQPCRMVQSTVGSVPGEAESERCALADWTARQLKVQQFTGFYFSSEELAH